MFDSIAAGKGYCGDCRPCLQGRYECCKEQCREDFTKEGFECWLDDALEVSYYDS